MKKIILVIGALLIAISAFAGSYTITTTASEDVILQEAATFYGAPVEYIIGEYKTRAISDLKPKMELERKRKLIGDYDQLTSAQKTAIESIVNPVFQSSTTLP